MSNELHGVCSVFPRFGCTGFWLHLNRGHSCRNRCNMRLLSVLPLSRLPAPAFRCIGLLRSHFCHTPSGVLSAAHLPLVPMAPMKHLNRGYSCCNRRNMHLLSALPLLRLPAPAFRCRLPFGWQEQEYHLPEDLSGNNLRQEGYKAKKAA